VTQIEPELWVERPLAAIAFYGRAFGAEVLHQVGEGEDIVARLEVHGARFWVATADLPSGRPAPPQIDCATARFLLNVPDPDEVFRRALDAGAQEALTGQRGKRIAAQVGLVSVQICNGLPA
jgi:PhnB protein